MMQPQRRRTGAWIVLAGALGCTPPATPANKAASGPTNQPVTTPGKTETTVVAQPVPEPTPAGSGELLDGRQVIASNEGPWTLRKMGPGDSVDGPKGFGGAGEGRGGPSGGGGADGAPAEMREESADMAAAPARAEMRMADPGSIGGAADAKKNKGADIGTGGAAPKSGKMLGPVEAAPLKAGSTDDNADFKGYLKFLETWTARSDVRGDFQPLDVQGRVFVRVVDGDRRPVPGAMVTVTDVATKATVWKATTYGDGRAPYYPRLFGQQQPGGKLEVTATIGTEAVTTAWDGAADVTLSGQGPAPASPGMALDVLFLLDTTGSMGDELDRIKTSLVTVTDKLRGKRDDLSLRYGAVAYKDISDEYVTMAHPFTEDTAAFTTAIQALTAGGGGDLPESLNQGLSRAVEGMQWRPGAAKVVFLVADAAPQMRFKGDILYGDSAVRAVGLGIRVHSVAASGLDPLGTLVLRQVAQLTRGKFIFIEYGGTQASAAKHGVSGPVEGGNNLDDILLKQLTAEIEGWGK